MTNNINNDDMNKVTGGIELQANNSVSLYKCSNCGSEDLERTFLHPSSKVTIFVYKCRKCGNTWNRRSESSDNNGALQ